SQHNEECRASPSARARFEALWNLYSADADGSLRRGRRIPDTAWPFGLGQDHLAESDRRLSRTDVGQDRDRLARCDRSSSTAEKHRHGFPELRLVSPHDGWAEHRIWPRGARCPKGRERATRGGGSLAHAARRIRQSAHPKDVWRPAAAGGARKGPDHRAGRSANGRTAERAGQAVAPCSPARTAPTAPGTWPHDDLCYA